MPVFEYQVKDPQGKTLEGTLDVSTREIAVRELRDQGYFPMRVQPQAIPAVPRKWSLGLALLPVKPRDRALFFRHLASTLKAGITPARALHTCEPLTQDMRLRCMIREWIPRVEGGEALSQVMRDYPQICTPVTADIVQAGEKGGFLDVAFNMIAEDLETEVEVRQQLKWQTLYFKMVLPLALLVPPIPRIITINGPDFSRYVPGLVDTTLPVMILLLAGFLVVRLGQHVPSLRRMMDALKMSLPGLSVFTRNAARARFVTNFAYLVRAGVPVAGALRSAAPTCGIAVMERALLAETSALDNGEKLTDVLTRSRQLGSHDLQIIATGEESGTLQESLERLAQHYRIEVKSAMKNLSNTLKIPLYLVAAAAVGYAVVTAAQTYFDRIFEIGDQMMNF